MTKPSQMNLPHLFTNRGYPISLRISSIWILSFLCISNLFFLTFSFKLYSFPVFTCFQNFDQFPLHLWNIRIFELTKKGRKEKTVLILRVNVFLPNKIVGLYAVRFKIIISTIANYKLGMCFLTPLYVLKSWILDLQVTRNSLNKEPSLRSVLSDPLS